jgi:uncharacterized coiled-coil protein SlyX
MRRSANAKALGFRQRPGYSVCDESRSRSFRFWRFTAKGEGGVSASRPNREGRSGSAPRALKCGGGSGTFGGMEGRVARLEAHVETLRSDVADLRAAVAALTEKVAVLTEKVAVLTERVAHLPSKGFVVSVNMTAIGFLGSLILFGEKLKALAGL